MKHQAIAPALRTIYHPIGNKKKGTEPAARIIAERLCRLLEAPGAARLELTGRHHHVWMTFRLRDETAVRSRWVRAKHTRKEIDDRHRAFGIAAARLSAAKRAVVDPLLDLMAVISAVEGGFGSRSQAWDTSVSLGIFQWAMARNQSSETGSLGRFFAALKQRAAAGTEPLYARAWLACTSLGLDFRDADRMLTLNGAPATGAQIEAALAGAMGGEELSSYQLRAGIDWIEEFRATPITPGPNGRMFLKHQWTVLGANQARLTSRGRARRSLVVKLPGAATVSQAFTSDGALATAVMLGVNRPSYVRLALWRALSGNTDPAAETDRLLEAVFTACVTAGAVPRPGKPFTEVEVNRAGAAAQTAYAALQRYLAPPATQPPGGESELRAAFESKAMLLYDPGGARRLRREGRFATVRVRFP